MQAVIFDLDGVIVDSGKEHKLAWIQTGEIIGRPVDDAFFNRTFGLPNRAIIELLLERPPTEAELKHIATVKEEAYRAYIANSIHALPGVVALLKVLRAADIKIALGTSAPSENVSLILNTLALTEYFDGISQEGDYQHGKPSPDVFLVAAKKVDAEATACVVIEDAPAGIAAAKAAGMKAVGVTTSHPASALHAADRIVDSLSELSVKTLCSLW